jgi:hemoglobin/transferrin/lactoferrin receptor protein
MNLAQNKHGAVAHQLRKTLLCAALTGMLGTSAMILTMPHAYAQAQQQTAFNIPASSLAAAIAAFGQQSGLQVTYLPELVADKTSRGVTGTMTPAAALQQVLADAGVAFRFVNESTISLVRVPAGSALSTGSSGLVLSTIEVTGIRETDPTDVPYTSAGSAAYISGEQIARYRGSSAGDFLAGIPGVLNGDNRNSGALDVNIRGLQGQSRVPVTVDGASNEVTVYRGYNGSTARTYVDPDFIGSAEIEKGASGAGDATGAIGGMVRMTTIGIKDILLPGREFGFKVKGSVNNNSSAPPAVTTNAGIRYGGDATMNRPSFLNPTGGSGSVAFAGTTEYLDFVAAYAQRYNGNYHAGENKADGSGRMGMVPSELYGWLPANVGLSTFRPGEQVLNTSTSNKSWLLKGTIKISDEQKLELAYNRYTSSYGEVMPTQIWDDRPYQGWLNTVDLASTTARYRFKPNNNDLIDLKVDAYFTNLDQRLNSALYGTPLSPVLYYTGQKRFGLNASNTSKFDTQLGSLAWTYGAGFLREFVGDPDGYTYSFADNIIGPPREGSRKEKNAFTSLDWKPTDWLTVAQSIRYSNSETYDAVPKIDYLGGSTYVRNYYGPEVKKHDGWSSVTSLTLEPVKGYQVYAKYGSVMRSPSIFESLTSLSFGLNVQDNASLPERNRSKEIGANMIKEGVFTANDKLKVHASYFDNHIDNYITRTNFKNEIFPGFAFYSLARVNLDYARMKGFELSSEYDNGNYFGGISWNHYVSMMFCAKEESPTDPSYQKCNAGGIYNSFTLQQIPPKDTVTLNLGARFLDRKLTVGGRMNYIGPRFVKGFGVDTKEGAYVRNQINPSVWDAYTLVDLYGSYKYSDALQFDITVTNLMDRYYMDPLNASLMPGAGRTLSASMSYKF